MQNLMIVDNSISNIKEIINNISKKVININIYNISTNADEVINIINNKEVDILLINLNFIGIDVLNFINDNIIDFYEKSIILFYENSKNIKNFPKNILNNKYIFECINFSNDIKILINLLQKITFLKERVTEENIIKSRIERELRKLNYNFEHIGTRYIVDAVYIIYLSKEYKINLNKNVYSVLSKKYNKPINTIKGDITQATKIMYYECD